jgi:DNA processing protein
MQTNHHTPELKDANNNQNCPIEKWLCLNAIPQMGIRRLQKSAEKLECKIGDLHAVSSKTLESIAWKTEQIALREKASNATKTHINKARKWLEQSNQHYFISIESRYYPDALRQLTQPPLFLFVIGNLEILNLPCLAFVGSRKASLYANQATHQLVREMAKHTQAASISGLALGVDAACHVASVANAVPTIAVLGCGVDVIYPKRHQKLYYDIANSGAIISEFLLGTQPSAPLFPRRNRIISGMSLGTVVIEAKIKSGSLITAKYAAEQNKEVFALPNMITNPNAEGCHWLIKNGAKLTESVHDIIEELPSIKRVDSLASTSIQYSAHGKHGHNHEKNIKNSNQSLASDLLLDNVGFDATSIDEIAKRTGMPLCDVLTQLLEYELRGLVVSSAEGYIKLGG